MVANNAAKNTIQSIGRGEFFSLALGLSLDGLAFGAAFQGLGSLGMLAMILVAGLIWLGLFAYVRLFAGISFAEAAVWAFGRAFGRIVLFLYAILWLLLAAVAALYAVRLWQALGISDTPDWFYALLFLAVAAVAAQNAGSMARLALLVVVPSLLLILANVGLTLDGADFANIMPLADVTFSADVQQGASFGLLLLGWECVLLPHFEQVGRVKNRMGDLALAMFVGIAVALFIGFGIKIVLSSVAAAYEFPLLQVFRLAKVGNWFSRFEVMGAGLLSTVFAIRVAAALSAVGKSLAYLWRVGENKGGNYKWVVFGAALAVWLLLYLMGEMVNRSGEMLLFKPCFLWALLLGSLVIPWVLVLAAGLKFKAEHRTVRIEHYEK